MDSGNFEELAVPLFGSLYSTARWLTGNREEAEDLVQESYAKALRGFSSYQQGTNFRAWLYRILRNAFLTSKAGLRMASLDAEEDDVPEPSTAVTPESILVSRYEREAVQAVLAGLPVNFREVIVLCDVEEMSYQEIAATLGIPVGTVMSRLSRARRAMRQRLGSARKGAAV